MLVENYLNTKYEFKFNQVTNRTFYKKIDSNEIVNIILEFIKINKPKVLNIAGNRESVSNGLEKKVFLIMNEVFKQLF